MSNYELKSTLPMVLSTATGPMTLNPAGDLSLKGYVKGTVPAAVYQKGTTRSDIRLSPTPKANPFNQTLPVPDPGHDTTDPKTTVTPKPHVTVPQKKMATRLQSPTPKAEKTPTSLKTKQNKITPKQNKTKQNKTKKTKRKHNTKEITTQNRLNHRPRLAAPPPDPPR